MGYLRPVPFTGTSTWANHRRRNPPSSEPGTDYYCPIGTPVHAAANGTVVNTSDAIGPAAGRYIAVDLDDGRRIRYLHLSKRLANVGDRVARGQVIAYSGATGYGKGDWSADPATGGAHVHTTLWGFHGYAFGVNATIDPELYMTDTPGGLAGGGSTPFEEDDMPLNDGDKEWLNRLGSAIIDQVGAKLLGPDWMNGLGSAVIDQTSARVLEQIPGAVWGQPVQAQDGEGNLQSREDGTPVMFPAAGFLASVSANAIAARTEIKDLHTGTVDVPALADALRKELAPEIVKALGAALVNG